MNIKQKRDETPHPQGGIGQGLLFVLIAGIVAAIAWGILSIFLAQPSKQHLSKSNGNGEPHTSSPIKINKAKNKIQTKADEDARNQRALEEERNKTKQQQRLDQLKRAEAAKQARMKRNVARCRKAISAKQWKRAYKLIGMLEDDQYDPEKTALLTEQVSRGKRAERQAFTKVNELLAKAQQLDNGKYSAKALEFLSQALLIMPKHPEVLRLYKKMNSYVNEIRVPEDVPTIQVAIPLLREGDTLLLAKGRYNAPLVLPKPIIIKGAGAKLTTIVCDTLKYSAIDSKKGKRPYEVSDLTITGTSYDDAAQERNPLIFVDGDFIFKNVVITRSSGHGIAVLSGKLVITDSIISFNAWDGISVSGKDATAVITNCKILNNYDHGVDFWQGAHGKVENSKLSTNSGSGAVVMGAGSQVELTQLQLTKNRQCGAVIAEQAHAVLKRVLALENTLSGIVVQGQGTSVEFGIVVSNKNREVGYFIDPQSKLIGFSNVTAEKNQRGNILRKPPTAPKELPKDQPPKNKNPKEKIEFKQPKEIPKAIIVP